MYTKFSECGYADITIQNIVYCKMHFLSIGFLKKMVLQTADFSPILNVFVCTEMANSEITCFNSFVIICENL